LLLDDLAVRTQRQISPFGHVEPRACLIELGLGDGARRPQLFDAVQVDLGLLAGRALRLDARFERLDLQGEFGIDDEGNAVSGGHLIALAHGERDDRAADARAGNQLPDGFHRRDDGLPVVDLLPGDGLLGGGG
jgi:hypothetical protein